MKGTSAQLDTAYDWSDDRLVSECLRGNERAWDALVERYKGLVFKICLDYTRSEPDAADVFQNVWIQAHRRLETVRDSGSVRAWLATVARNACYQWLKRRATRERRESSGLALADLDTRVAAPPLDLSARDQRLRVHQAIGQLAPRCQEVIRLLFFSQPPVPYREIATRLEMAVGSVPFMRARCLQRLHKLLDSEQEERG